MNKKAKAIEMNSNHYLLLQLVLLIQLDAEFCSRNSARKLTKHRIIRVRFIDDLWKKLFTKSITLCQKWWEHYRIIGKQRPKLKLNSEELKFIMTFSRQQRVKSKIVKIHPHDESVGRKTRQNSSKFKIVRCFVLTRLVKN